MAAHVWRILKLGGDVEAERGGDAVQLYNTLGVEHTVLQMLCCDLYIFIGL